MFKRILILECEPEKLARDGLHFADEAHSFLKTFRQTVGFGLHRLSVSSVEELEDKLDKLYNKLENEENTEDFEEGFNTIVVVGHSNHDGIQIGGEDGFIGWGHLAELLDDFDPQVLVLVACQAGNWLPAQQFFGNMKVLEELHGAPANLSREQARRLVYLILYLLATNESIPWAELGMGLINFSNTGAITLKYTREGYESNSPFEMLSGAIINALLGR